MEILSWTILALGGIGSGVLAGLLGIGGGFIIVSLLVALAYPPIQAIATSSLVIILNSSAGSFYNWRMGYLDFRKIVYIAIPAILAAQSGVYFATNIPPYVLLIIVGCFLLFNMFLIQLRKNLATQSKGKTISWNPIAARISTGGIAGFSAGLLGVGGGAIMVLLQMLSLDEDIKVAIRTSLGVILAATVSSCVVHASQGNVLFLQGLVLGIGGIVGTQVGSRVLPKLPDSVVSKVFCLFLAAMAVINFWQAWKSYAAS